MTPEERSRFAKYRDQLRGGPPRELRPCGTVAAALRHQRHGTPLCEPCREALREHQAKMYQLRKET